MAHACIFAIYSNIFIFKRVFNMFAVNFYTILWNFAQWRNGRRGKSKTYTLILTRTHVNEGDARQIKTNNVHNIIDIYIQ